MKHLFATITFYLSILFVCVSCHTDTKEVKTDKNQLETSADPTINSLNDAIKINPGNPKLYEQRAQFLLKDGKYDDALKDMYYCLNLDSMNVQYYFTVADIYIEMKDAKKAILSLQKGIEIDPKNAAVKVEAGRYCLYVKDYDKSLYYLNEALKLEGTNADAYFLKGIVFKEKKDINRALSNFQTCVEQDPLYYDAYMQMGLIHSNNNDPVAIQYFDNAIKANPKATDAMYAKGMFLQNQKKYQQAIEVYKEIIPIDLQNAKTCFSIGYCYMQIDSFAKAHTHFGMAIDIDPLYADAYYNRGLCAMAKNDMLDAQYNFKQALSIDPEMKKAEEALKNIKKTIK